MSNITNTPNEKIAPELGRSATKNSVAGVAVFGSTDPVFFSEVALELANYLRGSNVAGREFYEAMITLFGVSSLEDLYTQGLKSQDWVPALQALKIAQPVKYERCCEIVWNEYYNA